MRPYIKILLFALLPLSLLCFSSCSEQDDTVDEYANWQVRNDAYFRHLADSVRQLVSAGRKDWKVIKSYSKNPKEETDVMDYILVHVLSEGDGGECPLLSDTVRVNYAGSLMPTASYPNGFEFDKSYYGSIYNPNTAVPAKFGVLGVINGFATALQNMHRNDYWEVFVPYALGYGTAAQSTIPAYSTLKFKIHLIDFYHSEVPDWK